MKEFVSWKAIERHIDDISHYIETIRHEGIEFDNIYGIPRGGVILAVMLSHKTGIPYIESFEKVTQDTLIIDDIADTGETLKKYKKHPLSEKSFIITIHEHEQSIVKPDFSVTGKGDRWIVYPWETEDSKEIQDYLNEN